MSCGFTCARASRELRYKTQNKRFFPLNEDKRPRDASARPAHLYGHVSSARFGSARFSGVFFFFFRLSARAEKRGIEHNTVIKHTQLRQIKVK